MKWFVTIDGASHSYNAGVLYDLLFGNDEFLSQYYSINPLPSPNWLGHLLLAFFNEWFGVAAAAKMIHLLYGFGIIFAFRWLMFVVSPRPREMSYLIFPLVFNIIFLFGFYNFCLGVAIFLFSITAWLKYLSKPNWRSILLLVLLFTCGWFSHLLSWFFIGVFIFVSLLFEAIKLKSIRKIFKPLTVAFLSFLPSLVCWVIYTYSTIQKGTTDFQSVGDRLLGFIDLRFAVMLSRFEQPILILFVVLVLAFLAIGIYRAFSYRSQWNRETTLMSLIWVTMFSISLLAVMFFPENAGGGGIFGIRLQWIAWILLLVLVARFHYPARWRVTIAAVTVVLSLCRGIVIRDEAEDLNRNAHAAFEAGKYIRDQSTVLVLPFATNWFHAHLGKYALVGRDVALLSNYECDQKYFPLHWNEEAFPYRYQLASIDPTQVSCSEGWKTNLEKPIEQVDYIMIFGNMDNVKDTACAQKIVCAMDSLNYQAIYKKREVTLYEYKPQ